MTSIFDQVGGYPALTAVVDDFYSRVLADDQLSGFFTGTNLSRLKGMQVEFFGAALGGPDPYQGRSMAEVHRGRGIGQEHFDLVIGHLRGTLTDAGVAQPNLGTILDAVESLRPDIASALV